LRPPLNDAVFAELLDLVGAKAGCFKEGQRSSALLAVITSMVTTVPWRSAFSMDIGCAPSQDFPIKIIVKKAEDNDASCILPIFNYYACTHPLLAPMYPFRSRQILVQEAYKKDG
jgi:hypothetical protein